MRERGLEPVIPADAHSEASASRGARKTVPDTRDLRTLPWCSIDNDDSRDLDQLSAAEARSDGTTRILIAVADVDGAVPRDAACDRHAARNTTSVYTPGAVFPMLPERLSTDLTSLNPDVDRLAVVVDVTIAADGSVTASDVNAAWVRNHARLTYRGIGDWLEGRGSLPPNAAGFDEQLTLQDRAAQALTGLRRARGALEFASNEARPVFAGEQLKGVENETPNRAKSLIENLMIAANIVTASFLDQRGFPSLRRVVKSPARWDRIRELAASQGDQLPPVAEARALASFLERRRLAAPARFADLSVSVLSLLGSGEYIVDPPGKEPPGHFGLAVRDYGHSTAPNRRYPDLITQRLLKATLSGAPSPYSIEQLTGLAAHCTRQEDAAKKVERQVRKAAVAMLIESRVGDTFDAVVTGASAKGTYVRVASPLMEGRVMRGASGLDVGDRTRVRLDGVDVERGYINFSVETFGKG